MKFFDILVAVFFVFFSSSSSARASLVIYYYFICVHNKMNKVGGLHLIHKVHLIHYGVCDASERLRAISKLLSQTAKHKEPLISQRLILMERHRRANAEHF